MVVSEGDKRPGLDQPKTLSQAFNLGSSTAIQNVIEEIEATAAKRVKDGFNAVGFTLGVANSFFILFIFCSFPEHFWLIYIVEGLVLIPLKFIQMIRAVPNEALYYLDLCWIMNFSGIVALFVMIFGREMLSKKFIETLFHAAFGISCGPLMGANIALPFVALIFHDLASITGLFIHICPPILLYVMRWKAEAVTDAWPNTFDLDYGLSFFPNDDVSFMQSIFGATTTLYFLWFVPYVLWQLMVGLKLPKNGGKFDTVFHSTMRNGLCITMGNSLWKRPEELSLKQMKESDFEMRDFVAYCAFHVIGFFSSLLTLAYSCNSSKYAHGALLTLCLIVCIWRGGQRYTYYSTKMYSNVIRKKFADEVDKNE